MGQPLVSCIVPVFNGEKYLAEALDSIIQQTYQPLEIIVADDGSTDETPTVVARYGDQIRCLRQNNSGVSIARNLGLSVARGEFVAFLDADDLWHPDKLERQMARFEARPELDLCVTHLQNFWIPELEEEKTRFQNHRLAEVLPGFAMQTLVARRAFFEKVGGFNAAFKMGEDIEWFLRAAEQGAVMELLPDLLVRRRLHENNLSMHPGTRMQKGLLEIVKVVKGSLDRRRHSHMGLASLNIPTSQRNEKE